MFGRSGFSRDHCGIEDGGSGLKPLLHKIHPCRSGFSRDFAGSRRGGLEWKTLHSGMIALAIRTPVWGESPSCKKTCSFPPRSVWEEEHGLTWVKIRMKVHPSEAR